MTDTGHHAPKLSPAAWVRSQTPRTRERTAAARGGPWWIAAINSARPIEQCALVAAPRERAAPGNIRAVFVNRRPADRTGNCHGCGRRIFMPFRIAKSFTVESGHLLTKHPGACRFPHGHSRTIEIVVVSHTLDARDMVCDFKALSAVATEAVQRLDHAFALNTSDPRFAEMRAAYGERVLAFPGVDPTSEILAREIFRLIGDKLASQSADPAHPIASHVRLERVRVTETGTSWAEYWE